METRTSQSLPFPSLFSAFVCGSEAVLQGLQAAVGRPAVEGDHPLPSVSLSLLVAVFFHAYHCCHVTLGKQKFGVFAHFNLSCENAVGLVSTAPLKAHQIDPDRALWINRSNSFSPCAVFFSSLFASLFFPLFLLICFEC